MFNYLRLTRIVKNRKEPLRFLADTITDCTRFFKVSLKILCDSRPSEAVTALNNRYTTKKGAPKKSPHAPFTTMGAARAPFIKCVSTHSNPSSSFHCPSLSNETGKNAEEEAAAEGDGRVDADRDAEREAEDGRGAAHPAPVQDHFGRDANGEDQSRAPIDRAGEEHRRGEERGRETQGHSLSHRFALFFTLGARTSPTL